MRLLLHYTNGNPDAPEAKPERLSPKLLACRLTGQLGLSCGKEGTTEYTGLVSEHCDYNPVLQKTFSLSYKRLEKTGQCPEALGTPQPKFWFPAELCRS